MVQHLVRSLELAPTPQNPPVQILPSTNNTWQYFSTVFQKQFVEFLLHYAAFTRGIGDEGKRERGGEIIISIARERVPWHIVAMTIMLLLEESQHNDLRPLVAGQCDPCAWLAPVMSRAPVTLLQVMVCSNLEALQVFPGWLLPHWHDAVWERAQKVVRSSWREIQLKQVGVVLCLGCSCAAMTWRYSRRGGEGGGGHMAAP